MKIFNRFQFIKTCIGNVVRKKIFSNQSSPLRGLSEFYCSRFSFGNSPQCRIENSLEFPTMLLHCGEVRTKLLHLSILRRGEEFHPMISYIVRNNNDWRKSPQCGILLKEWILHCGEEFNPMISYVVGKYDDWSHIWKVPHNEGSFKGWILHCGEVRTKLLLFCQYYLVGKNFI